MKICQLRVNYADCIIVDYNSWIESDKALRLASTLKKDDIIVEGYKEYDTGRTYMAKMGDWRQNKDEEINLDGIGGVNIVVKGDVHRSGMPSISEISPFNTNSLRHQLPMLCI